MLALKLGRHALLTKGGHQLHHGRGVLQLQKPVEHVNEHLVVGGGNDGPVKALQLIPAGAEVVPDSPALLLVGPESHLPGRLRLQKNAQVGGVQKGLGIAPLDRLALRQLLPVHKQVAPLPFHGLDHARLPQKPQGLPHRDAADPHHLHQLFFAGEQIPLLVDPLGNHGVDPLHHLFIKLFSRGHFRHLWFLPSRVCHSCLTV